MELAAYLDRIGFSGRPAIDVASLRRLQRLHLLAIPYENVDVLLGRTVTLDPAAAFDKMVTRRRGGWCYEMNGLFGWALAEIGFPVKRLASGVMRSMLGEQALGNHLVLRVDTGSGAYLADVGLGEGPIRPFAIREGSFGVGGSYRVEALKGGWWRLHNRPGARPPDFDFHPERVDEALLHQRCVFLRTDPQSMFVQNLICQRYRPGGHVRLLGKVLRTSRGGRTSERVLRSADDLNNVLTRAFGLAEPAADGLWPLICRRHDELFG